MALWIELCITLVSMVLLARGGGGAGGMLPRENLLFRP